MTTTIQKHSWCAASAGAASQASTQAAAQVTIVNAQASRIVSAPLGSGRTGLFTRSMSRS